MNEEQEFEKQFKLSQRYYLENLDFINWYWYFFIIKEVIHFKPNDVLEIGSGSGIIKNCLKPLVGNYMVLDINPQLKPDILGDVRICNNELNNKFNLIIMTDVLEHIPFSDVEQTVQNLFLYLKNGGEALITIPHRRSNFLFMTPTQKPHVFTIPTGFLSPGAFYRRFIKRKIWIDPHHRWEIGDGKINKGHLDKIFQKISFKTERFKKLICVDFWVLKKL